MTDYKIGDRVVVVDDTHYPQNNKHTGAVTAVGTGVWPISVKFDDPTGTTAGDDGTEIFDENELALLPEHPADPELRERMLDKAIQAGSFGMDADDIVASARAFESYVLGDTK